MELQSFRVVVSSVYVGMPAMPKKICIYSEPIDHIKLSTPFKLESARPLLVNDLPPQTGGARNTITQGGDSLNPINPKTLNPELHHLIQGGDAPNPKT
jgi:hypothetical protein